MRTILILAGLLSAAPALAAPFEGACALFAATEPKLLAEKSFRLESYLEEETIYEEGSVSYVVSHTSVGDEKIGEKEYFSLTVKDPARGLELLVSRPNGSTYEDDLQLRPPFGLPLAICYPRAGQKPSAP